LYESDVGLDNFVIIFVDMKRGLGFKAFEESLKILGDSLSGEKEKLEDLFVKS